MHILHLSSFTEHYVYDIYPYSHSRSFSWLYSIQFYEKITIYPPAHDGYLGCFKFGTVMNRAAECSFPPNSDHTYQIILEMEAQIHGRMNQAFYFENAAFTLKCQGWHNIHKMIN